MGCFHCTILEGLDSCIHLLRVEVRVTQTLVLWYSVGNAEREFTVVWTAWMVRSKCCFMGLNFCQAGV